MEISIGDPERKQLVYNDLFPLQLTHTADRFGTLIICIPLAEAEKRPGVVAGESTQAKNSVTWVSNWGLELGTCVSDVI